MPTFTVDGKPIGQPRHRSTRTGHHYIPADHAIHAFKEITSPYWLNEKRLKDHKIALIGEKIARAASRLRA